MIAKIVFWGWPFVTYILFKRLPLIPAVLCSVLAGYLLLPRHITLDLPALPAITRSSMTIGTAIICALIVLWKSQSTGLRPAEQIPLPRMLPGWIPQNKVIKILFFGMVFGPAMTAITNRDVIVRYIVDQGTISPQADANWTFATLPDTSVLFDTGPRAKAYAADVKGVSIEEAGDGPDGFARFKIDLGAQ